jgi:hypothetical protein
MQANSGGLPEALNPAEHQASAAAERIFPNNSGPNAHSRLFSSFE